MLDAWQRRKQYEARLLSLEIVKTLAEAVGIAGGSGYSGGGEKWIEPNEMLNRMGIGDL